MLTTQKAVDLMRQAEGDIIAAQAKARELLYGREHAEAFEAKALRKLADMSDDQILNGEAVYSHYDPSDLSDRLGPDHDDDYEGAAV